MKTSHFGQMNSETIIDEIYYDSPERGWKTENNNHVKSVIFKMKQPVEVEGVVSDEWVMLVEPKILDQVQIASVDRNTPIGWQLGEKVYNSQPALDKEAIEWLAQNYSLLDE